MAGLYIHVPFCASRCAYCGFYSTTSEGLADDYVSAACAEMELRAAAFTAAAGQGVSTIYIGGGTPSRLSEVQLDRLFAGVDKAFGAGTVDACGEVTMECNPDDVTDGYAAAIGRLPVGRVSLGVQTFHDPTLRRMRRRHSSADIRPAVERLRRAGIGNISIDLMFGFPGETIERWMADVDTAVALGVEHISAYSLAYEPGTPLFRDLEKGNIEEIGEEDSRAMYYGMADRLCAAGYEHYEISNFAKPGRRALHNSSYWDGTSYMGIGPAAHSYRKSERSWNTPSLKDYLRLVGQGKPATCGSEEIGPVESYNDAVATAMRTREGLSIDSLPGKFAKHAMAAADRHIAAGLVEYSAGRLSLTRAGLYVSDYVMADLIYTE